MDALEVGLMVDAWEKRLTEERMAALTDGEDALPMASAEEFFRGRPDILARYRTRPSAPTTRAAALAAPAAAPAKIPQPTPHPQQREETTEMPRGVTTNPKTRATVLERVRKGQHPAIAILGTDVALGTAYEWCRAEGIVYEKKPMGGDWRAKKEPAKAVEPPSPANPDDVYAARLIQKAKAHERVTDPTHTPRIPSPEVPPRHEEAIQATELPARQIQAIEAEDADSYDLTPDAWVPEPEMTRPTPDPELESIEEKLSRIGASIPPEAWIWMPDSSALHSRFEFLPEQAPEQAIAILGTIPASRLYRLQKSTQEHIEALLLAEVL